MSPTADAAAWWLTADTTDVPPASRQELAHIRGALWTARLDLPWGPRPGQADNVVCIDYFECYSPIDQARIIRAYGPKSERGYTHAPMGPLIDPGYHDQLPATDWRANPNVYFSAAERLERAGIHVVHFLRPDRGVVGLDWNIDDLDAQLGAIFRSDRAQALMRIVCLGWEPGPRYFYDSAWWASMCGWMALTFPNALRYIHMTADTDAPVGGDDDKRGISNGQGWARVAPFIHGWLVQNSGYTDGPSPTPSAEFIRNFTDQFSPHVRGSLAERFLTGGPPGDWPTYSAWGDHQPIQVVAAEYASFASYWHNWPEDQARRLGQLALAAGAAGAFDGC